MLVMVWVSLTRLGRVAQTWSRDDQNIGGITNRVFSGEVAPDGGVTREKDQEDQDFANTRRSNLVQAQDGKQRSCNLDDEDSKEEEDPNIVEYYSDADIGISSKDEDDFVIVN